MQINEDKYCIIINGLCSPSHTGIFSFESNIYMSLRNNINDFIRTLNHEFIHSYHYSTDLFTASGRQLPNYTEFSAYTFTVQNGSPESIGMLLQYPYLGPRSPYDWPSYLIPQLK